MEIRRGAARTPVMGTPVFPLRQDSGPKAALPARQQ